jgi:hypothetical protein
MFIIILSIQNISALFLLLLLLPLLLLFLLLLPPFFYHYSSEPDSSSFSSYHASSHLFKASVSTWTTTARMSSALLLTIIFMASYASPRKFSTSKSSLYCYGERECGDEGTKRWDIELIKCMSSGAERRREGVGMGWDERSLAPVSDC